MSSSDPVLMIADPRKTRVRIWIPEANNIALDRSVALRVILNVRPTEALLARLDYVGHQARPNADNLLSFAAEADWFGEAPETQLGLRGTAVLYGERVSLAYWLLRRPFSSLRQWFGF